MYYNGEFDGIIWENRVVQQQLLLDSSVAEGVEIFGNKNKENQEIRLEFFGNKNKVKLGQEPEDREIKRLKYFGIKEKLRHSRRSVDEAGSVGLNLEDCESKTEEYFKSTQWCFEDRTRSLVIEWIAEYFRNGQWRWWWWSDEKNYFFVKALFKNFIIFKLDNLRYDLNKLFYFVYRKEKIFGIIRWSVLNQKIMNYHWSWMEDPKEWTLVRNKFNVTYGSVVFRQNFICSKFVTKEMETESITDFRKNVDLFYDAAYKKIKEIKEKEEEWILETEILKQGNAGKEEVQDEEEQSRAEHLKKLKQQIAAQEKAEAFKLKSLKQEWAAHKAKAKAEYLNLSKQELAQKKAREFKLNKLKQGLAAHKADKAREFKLNKLEQEKYAQERARVESLIKLNQEWAAHPKESKEGVESLKKLKQQIAAHKADKENLEYVKKLKQELAVQQKERVESLKKLKQQIAAHEAKAHVFKLKILKQEICAREKVKGFRLKLNKLKQGLAAYKESKARAEELKQGNAGEEEVQDEEDNFGTFNLQEDVNALSAKK